MEAIGYIASRDFILVGITSNERKRFGKQEKVFRLSPGILLTYMGNPYKATELREYANKEAEAEEKKNFSSIIDDVKKVFEVRGFNLNKAISKIEALIKRFTTADGRVETSKIEKYLNDEEILLLREVISSSFNSHFASAVLTLIGYNRETGLEFANMAPVGGQLKTSIAPCLVNNQLYTQLFKVGDDATSSDLLKRMNEQLTPFATSGWHMDKDIIAEILDSGKNILAHSIKELLGAQKKVDVVFYELSHRTNFEFSGPTSRNMVFFKMFNGIALLYRRLKKLLLQR